MDESACLFDTRAYFPPGEPESRYIFLGSHCPMLPGTLGLVLTANGLVFSMWVATPLARSNLMRSWISGL
jgi:hypothetical protein